MLGGSCRGARQRLGVCRAAAVAAAAAGLARLDQDEQVAGVALVCTRVKAGGRAVRFGEGGAAWVTGKAAGWRRNRTRPAAYGPSG